MKTLRPKTWDDVSQALLAKHEIALLDVSHETQFARTHPLFAANLALEHIERDAWRRIPRHDTFEFCRVAG